MQKTRKKVAKPVSTATDHTARGEHRRQSLLAATLKIIVRDGPGAVSFRSVVKEAKASHGSIRYYFGTREDLIHEALKLTAKRNIEALAAAWVDFERYANDPRQLAEMISKHSVRQMIEDPAMGTMIIEFHLAASRIPALRSELREWGRAYARITHDSFVRLGSDHPETDSALLTNLISGHIMRQLALHRADFEAAVLRPAVERFLISIGKPLRAKVKS